jgi:hypothetical protein
MKAVSTKGGLEASIRAGNIHAPKAVPTLSSGEKHYLGQRQSSCPPTGRPAWRYPYLVLGDSAACPRRCADGVCGYGDSLPDSRGLSIVGYSTADGRWKAPLASDNNRFLDLSVI